MNAQGKNSITRLPRVSVISQFSLPDVAIVILLALGGFTGFPGFPKFADIKTQIASLDYKTVWVFLLLAFNCLLIYRKIAKCYFSAWLAGVHALAGNLVITAICWIITKLSFLAAMTVLDSLIAVQAGMAAIYFTAQSWFEFKPDLKNLAKVSKSIEADLKHIVGLEGRMVTADHVKRASDLCNKFKHDADVALLECPREAREELDAEKKRIERILRALGSPTWEVPDALKRANAT